MLKWSRPRLSTPDIAYIVKASAEYVASTKVSDDVAPMSTVTNAAQVPTVDNTAPSPADIQPHLEQLPWYAQWFEPLPSATSDLQAALNTLKSVKSELWETPLLAAMHVPDFASGALSGSSRGCQQPPTQPV